MSEPEKCRWCGKPLPALIDGVCSVCRDDPPTAFQRLHPSMAELMGLEDEPAPAPRKSALGEL